MKFYRPADLRENERPPAPGSAMSGNSRRLPAFVAFTLAGIFVLALWGAPGQANSQSIPSTPVYQPSVQTELPDGQALALLRQFEPILVFHAQPRPELFRPTAPATFIRRAELEQRIGSGLDKKNWRPLGPAPSPLPTMEAPPNCLRFPCWRLNLDGSPDCDLSIEPHYQDLWLVLPPGGVPPARDCSPAPAPGGPRSIASAPLVAYGRAVQGSTEQCCRDWIALQYWFFYTYNAFASPVDKPRVFQAHEGDWEHVAVLLNSQLRPRAVFASQHNAGLTLPWAKVPDREGDHPVIYVARGSHANYFVPGRHKLDLAALTGILAPLQPGIPRSLGVKLISDTVSPLPLDAAACPPVQARLYVGPPGATRPCYGRMKIVLARRAPWLPFPGLWGEREFVRAQVKIAGRVITVHKPQGESPGPLVSRAAWKKAIDVILGRCEPKPAECR